MAGTETTSACSPLATIAEVPVESGPDRRRVVTSGLTWRQGFVALRHRNYRLFFWGQLISLTGTWMQSVAQGWLVYQLTGNEFMLGFIAFLGMFPVTLLTAPAGTLADRLDKRRILVGTQVAGMLLAFALAAVALAENLTDTTRIWLIGAIAVLLGLSAAFDIPTRQSFVVDLVGRDDLANAIALNSTMFNIARILGPALAGLLIYVPWIGIGGCFLLNGLSYLAVIAGYARMQLPLRPPAVAAPPPLWHSMLAAARFVRDQPVVRRVITLVGLFSLLVFPFATLFPVFARESLQGDARTYGLLGTANGLGALLGALTLAFLGDRGRQRRQFYLGLIGFCLGTGLFALSTHLVVSLALLVMVGWCFITALATANTTVQHLVPDQLRGGVMGIYTLAFLGLAPLGSLLLGAAARFWTASWTVATGAGLCLGLALVMAQRPRAQASPAPPPQPPNRS